MSTYTVAFTTLAAVCGGILAGILLRLFLPASHLHDESKDVVKSAAALMATLVALVIGLLVGSAKESFDSTSTTLTNIGTKIISLDRVLARYGSEMKPTRDELREAVKKAVDTIWQNPDSAPTATPGIDLVMTIETIHDRIRDEQPKTEAQKILQGQAITLCNEVIHSLWQIIEQNQTEPPAAFLIVLIFWLAVLFMSFGLLAPRNATAICAMLICAVSIAFAIFLILEMNRPFQGAIQVSSGPMTKAIRLLDRP